MGRAVMIFPPRTLLKKSFPPLAAVFILLLAVFLSPAPAQTEQIKILLLTPPHLSGSPWSKAYLKGAELAAAEINAREGQRGLQILLVLRSGDPLYLKKGEDLRDLIADQKIQFLMGDIQRDSIPLVSQVAQEKKVPFLAFPFDFLDSPPSSGDSNSFFWISPAPEAFQRATVRMSAQLPLKRYFFLSRDSQTGRTWAKYFWEELRRLKPDFVMAGEMFVPAGTEDYTPAIEKILSADTELCISFLGANAWPRFIKSGKKMGYFKKTTHFEVESGSQESLTALKTLSPEGIWGVSAFPFWALGLKETREFVARYRQKTGSYPNLEALSGYVSLYALTAAMKKADSAAPEKVTANLKGLAFRTPVGTLNIHPADNRVLWPIWCGATQSSTEYPFQILGDLKAFGPDSFAPQAETVVKPAP